MIARSPQFPRSAPVVTRGILLALTCLAWFSAAPSVAVRIPPPLPPVPSVDPNPTDPMAAEPVSESGEPVSYDLESGAAARLPLPDLQTLPPSGIRIQVLADGQRVIRFHNTIWNNGRAPLEVIGDVNPASGRIEVRQRLTIAGETGVDLLIGQFIWHPYHNHWHIPTLAEYQLWTLTPYEELETLVASGDKISYCLIDTDIIDPALPEFRSVRGYRGCGRLRQGLSIGWGDEYRSHLEGQSLPIRGLPDGVYALVSTANPAAVLMESNYSNNAAIVHLRIEAGQVRIFPSVHSEDALCRAEGKC